MKIGLTILTLFLTTSLVSAQSCGIYRVKYRATFDSDSLRIKSVKLPTTAYFHGLEDINAESGTQEFVPVGLELNAIMLSHLSCYVSSTSENMIERYKKERKTVPVTIIAVDSKNTEFTIQTDIPLDQIQFKTPVIGEMVMMTIELGQVSF